MSENSVQPIIGLPPVKYQLAEEQLAAWREEFKDLVADTPAGYESVTKAIAVTRRARGDVERTRVQLKAEALRYGREVDAEAKRWTIALEKIEDPLRLKKETVDAAKRAEAEAKALAVKQAQEAETKRIADEAEAKRQADIAEERRVLQAEADRLAEERKKLDAEQEERRKQIEAQQSIEREMLAQERRKLLAEAEARAVAEKAERDRIDRERTIAEAKAASERAKLEEERRAVEAEKRAIQLEREKAERAEFERSARIKADEEAKRAAEQREKDRIERERMAEELAEHNRRVFEEEAAAERKRLDDLKPDIERIREYGSMISGLASPPTVKDAKAKAFLKKIGAKLTQLAEQCRNCSALTPELVGACEQREAM